MNVDQHILDRIPHRAPFLFLDHVIEMTDTSLRASKFISGDEDFFKGHYPGNPIMPGVLICEAVFQAGAMLISSQMHYTPGQTPGDPVLVKIGDARFKGMVKPGTELIILAEIVDTVSSAYYMKGTVTAGGRKILRVEFTVTLAGGD